MTIVQARLILCHARASETTLASACINARGRRELIGYGCHFIELHGYLESGCL
ncbi:hypothetical protein PtB15_14B382 [Puccinia triticina]|nr:hypothetical protein PtB15_14B382 [Puccinia triticina]